MAETFARGLNHSLDTYKFFEMNDYFESKEVDTDKGRHRIISTIIEYLIHSGHRPHIEDLSPREAHEVLKNCYQHKTWSSIAGNQQFMDLRFTVQPT